MIEIREARLEDLDAIVSLLSQLKGIAAPHSTVEYAPVQKTLRAMLQSPEVYRNYVALVNNRVVGLLTLILYKTLLHPGGTALINEVVVSEQVRRRGIGRRLVEAAMAEAREKGMDEIEVGTETDNATARRFYSSMGFDQEYFLFGREF